MKATLGIHHISSIVGNPQENADFYANVLGLRLVKKTVNFDDPETYHLYFGNKEARPGSIITFFPWVNGRQGHIGGGQVGVTSYAVPAGSFSFWEERLTKKSVPFKKNTRLGENTIQFQDPHGLLIELVERKEGPFNSWSNDGISSDVAIKGFAGAILYSSQPEETIRTLADTMGLHRTDEDSDYIRFKANADIGNTIDVKREAEPRGRSGVGTVHHIAWRASNEADHLEWQEHIADHGYNVTEVKDRKYFKSIYFREHGHILFEVATDGPGFTVDEPFDNLGETLKLPEHYEQDREQLEQHLIPIEIEQDKN